MFGDEVETRDQTGADRQQPAGQTAGRATAVDVLHVDTELVAVALGESPQASLQQPDLGRGRPLLRGEDAGRIDEPGAHVAGDVDLDSAEPGTAAERFDRSEPAVGGCRSAETDEHGAGALVDRLGDQFTRAPGRRRERVIVLRSAGEDQPTRPGHLDDCRAAVDPPRGLDGWAKWPGHHGRSVAAPEHIEQAFPAVGHRNFVAVGAELPARCSDRDGRLGSSQRAAELVEGGDDPHPRTVVSNRRVPVGPKRHIGTLRSSPAGDS